MIGIYKIKNKINKKIYVGQSNNIQRRWREHLRSGQPEKYSNSNNRDIEMPLHRAMQKYGVENFELEVLEECDIAELNIKERYWINQLNSTDKNIGYNILNGGQENIGAKGEFHSQAKLTQIEVNEIKEILKNNHLILLEEIAQQYGVSKSTICMINTGKTWHDDKIQYPLRPTIVNQGGSKSNGARFTEKEVWNMRVLYYQGKTHPQIVEIYKGESENTIRAILQGKTWTKLPIYKKMEKTWYYENNPISFEEAEEKVKKLI